MGGSSSHKTTQKYDGIIVQSSLKGIPVAKGWGTNRSGANLIDYLDFTSKKVSSSSGKGGGAPANYNYYGTLLLAFGMGSIFGVRTIYKDSAYYVAEPGGTKEVNGTQITYSSKTPVQAAGLSQLFTGAIGQTPWPYLTSRHPANALGYSGLAYVAAENYNLNSSATPPNFNFEVQWPVFATINGVQQDDANPADILDDLLPNVPRWPGASAIASLATYNAYCYAQGLLLSPMAGDGRQASDLITEILTCSNSDCFVSEGLFQVVPYGDTNITNNGATYTAPLTPVYSLTFDDLIPNGDEDPIQWDIKPEDKCYNVVTVGYLDRTQQYASDSVPAVDQAAYLAFGKNQQDALSYESICLSSVATTVAQLIVQRSANVRRTAQFTTSELFGLLDPMDLIEVPAPDGTPTLVRVTDIAEQEDGSIQFTVEEMLVGTSHTPLFTRQSGLGIPANFAVDPGDSAPPVIINPPASLTGGEYQAWIATSGGPQWGGAEVWVSLDGDDFYLQGIIDQPGRFGTTTADFPSGSDPDKTNTLSIDLTASTGALTTAAQADADAQTTLCAVGTEVIAYSAATATGAYTYNLGTYIRRGLEGTTIADQPKGSEFLRLDESVLAIPYNSGQIGKTVYVKLASFNQYGNALQDLSLCETYTFTAQANSSNVGEVTWSEIQGIPATLTQYVNSGGVSVSTQNITTSTTVSGASSGSGISTLNDVLSQLATAQSNAQSALSQVTTANTQIASLTSAYGSTWMNTDPTFVSYLNGATGAPPGWQDDQNAATYLKWCSGFDSQGAFRAVLSSGQAVQIESVNNGSLGNAFPGYYVIELDAYLESGSWQGTIAFLTSYSSSNRSGTYNGTVAGSVLDTSAAADLNGVVSTMASGRRQFGLLVNAQGSFQSISLVLQVNGGYSLSPAKTIQIHKCAVRPASAADLSAAQVGASFNSFSTTQTGLNSSYASNLTDLNSWVGYNYNGSNPGPSLQSQVTTLSQTVTQNGVTFAQQISTVTSRVVGNFGVNLIANPAFALGANVDWTTYPAGAVSGNFGPQGSGLIYNPGQKGTLSTAYIKFAQSATFGVDAGQQYSFQAIGYTGGIGSSTTNQRWMMSWFTASGASASTDTYLLETNVAAGWQAFYRDSTNGGTITAPSGAVSALIYVDLAASSGNLVVSGDNIVFGAMKLEQGTVCTPLNDTQLSATVSSNATSIATLAGQLYATYTLTATAGNVVTGMQLISASGAQTISSVIFQAENFLIKSAAASGITSPFYYNSETGTLSLQNIVVTNAVIGTAAIGTLNLAGGAVSSYFTQTFLASGGGQPISPGSGGSAPPVYVPPGGGGSGGSGSGGVRSAQS